MAEENEATPSTENAQDVISKSLASIIEPERGTDEEIEEKQKFLTFALDAYMFGLQILDIHEIIRPLNVTRLPNAPRYVLGVLNLRGEIVPVIDLQFRLKQESTVVTETARIIVVETADGRKIGLLVSSVYHVEQFRESEIEKPRQQVSGFSADFFSGYVSLKNKIILLLKLEHIVE